MRDWLKKQYPQGVGLGDLVREYVEIETNTYYRADEDEQKLRASEIIAFLNYLNKISTLPTFSDEFGKIYIEGKEIEL